MNLITIAQYISSLAQYFLFKKIKYLNVTEEKQILLILRAVAATAINKTLFNIY